MKLKKIVHFILVFLFIVILNGNISAEEKYSQIARRIAGRAEIIREHVSSLYDTGVPEYHNLFYFIISTLEDSSGLYCLSDKKNAAYKLLVLDAITYDLVCAGSSALYEINKLTGELQKSKNAGNLEKFKEIIEDNLQIVTQRGLQESAFFTNTEERIFAFVTNRIVKIASKIKKANNKNKIKKLLSSLGVMDSNNIKFWMPDSVQPPLTEYFIPMVIDKQWGLVANIHFEDEKVKPETLVLALFNLLAYEEGLAINNNESLESQVHYILTQMRMCDWILKNSVRFGIKDTSNLIQYRKWFQDAFERLAGESFVPQYYEQLFRIKESPVVKRELFDWDTKAELTESANSPQSDDYVFYFMGNGSQMPPNLRIKTFLSNNNFPVGTAFDIGCGDGSNTRLLAESGLFKSVVAIDHSKAAVDRIKRLEFLEQGLEGKIRAVQSDVLAYKYPSTNSPLHQKASLVVIDNVLEFLPHKKRIALLQNLKNALLSGGFIYIEYHIAEGKKFEELKADTKNEITPDNDLIIENEFQGKQKKHFYKKGEMLIDLNKMNIKDGNGFSIKEEIVDDNSFKVGVLTIKKD